MANVHKSRWTTSNYTPRIYMDKFKQKLVIVNIVVLIKIKYSLNEIYFQVDNWKSILF